MRTPELLLTAVDAEDVLHNDLYRPGRIQPGTTWCNLFVCNVTKRLDVEVPFEISPGRFLRVNDQARWLRGEGAQRWHSCDAPGAFLRANLGYPTVAVWEGESDSHGHIAVVIPSFTLGAGKEDQLAIAQAGRTNFPRGRLAQGFDSLPVRFYTAD